MQKWAALLLFILTTAVSYGQRKGEKHQSSPELNLIATDKAFCEMAKLRGAGPAFIYFAADEVIKMRNKQQPLQGKNALIAAMANDSSKALSWTPLYAMVSKDLTLGYTFGEYQYKPSPADPVVFGNYFTIWKRQKDGTYKYVLDGGTPTPGPVTLSH